MTTNYIIDPSVFYWIHTFSDLKTLSTVLAVALIIGTVIVASCWIYNYFEYIDCEINRYKRYYMLCRRLTFILGIPGILCLLAAIFLPDIQTSIEMLVARTATYDNVSWTVDQVKEVIDYIVKALQ